MNILMMTNTFLPHVGGVANSIASFSEVYRQQGHRVMVVAPEYGKAPAREKDVVRIPAIQRFNNSDFSVVLPLPRFLAKIVEQFEPDLVHSHHPFLIGGTALRIAHTHELPLVFTHHTMYERYTHNVPGDCQALKKFIIRLATSYANLCDQVFAPSASLAAILARRGVTAPVSVVPTGIDPARFSRGSGAGFRAALGIPAEAFLIGHLGRMAPEKNLDFLGQAIAAYLKTAPGAHFLLIGSGPSVKPLQQIFAAADLADRLHSIGILDGALVVSAYQSMDLFAFASESETQGIVLLEAMAAGVPVMALDAPGARDIVVDGENGRLLARPSVAQFAEALAAFAALPAGQRIRLRQGARKTAAGYSHERTAALALALYEKLVDGAYMRCESEYNAWRAARRLIEAEWDLLKNVVSSAEAALSEEGQPDDLPS